MNIIIKSSAIQFKNPKTGQPTRAVEEHYIGRRISVLINDGVVRTFRFKKDELPFYVEEEDMIKAVEERIRGEG